MVKQVLILLLLALPLSAADFLDTQGEIGNTAKQLLGYQTGTSAAVDSVFAKWVKLATIDVNTAALGIRVTDTVYSKRFQEAYTIDSIIAPLAVWISTRDTLIALRRVPMSGFSLIYSTPINVLTSSSEDGSSHSPYYDWVNNRILLYPTPVNANDTIIVEGLRKIQNIESDTTFPSQLELHYRSAILYRTCYLAAKSKQMGSAASWLEDYRESIGNINTVVNAGVFGEAVSE